MQFGLQDILAQIVYRERYTSNLTYCSSSMLPKLSQMKAGWRPPALPTGRQAVGWMKHNTL
jgi:hypothetical protein